MEIPLNFVKKNEKRRKVQRRTFVELVQMIHGNKLHAKKK